MIVKLEFPICIFLNHNTEFKKNPPEILIDVPVIVLVYSYHPALFGTAHSPKHSGTCTSRCPFLFRSIVKRPAMTGSKAGPLRGDTASPRVSEGTGGARAFPVPEWPEPFPVPFLLSKGPASEFLRAPKMLTLSKCQGAWGPFRFLDTMKTISGVRVMRISFQT